MKSDEIEQQMLAILHGEDREKASKLMAGMIMILTELANEPSPLIVARKIKALLTKVQ